MPSQPSAARFGCLPDDVTDPHASRREAATSHFSLCFLESVVSV